MKTLGQQLRRYGEIVEDAQQQVTLDEVLASGDVIELVQPVRRCGSRAWVAIGAAVAVVLIAVMSLVLAPDRDTIIDEPPPPTDWDDSAVIFNGHTFRIDDQGEGDTPYRFVVRSQTGEWNPVEGFTYEYLPVITAGEDRIMVVSPSPASDFREACDQAVVQVAVSNDGETWHRTSLDDLGPDVGNDADHECFQWAGSEEGGDAVGPRGMLVVRAISRCCVEPDLYPHFWFSPDGVDWQRVSIPEIMLGSPYNAADFLEWPPDPDAPDPFADFVRPVSWGSPTVTTTGFAIEVGRRLGDQSYVETWETPDGLNWELIETANLVDIATFNGHTFGIQMPSDNLFRLVEHAEGADWRPIQDFAFEYPPSITTGDDAW